MYDVAYMHLDDIIKNYKIIGSLSYNHAFQECLILNTSPPVSIVLNDGITISNSSSEPLKDLVRCYIIKQENILELLTISEIIDRYR